MATVGMQNLNAPATEPGQVSGADLLPWQRTGSAAGVEEIDAIHRRAMPGCVGPCNQGRKLCPCPDACEQRADDDALAPARGAIFALAITGTAFAVGALLWIAFR